MIYNLESQPVPSTLVSEAARTLIIFSGVTILPDIPEYYRKYPALLNFLSAQKMPWKESRTLAGAATNESGRTIELPLSFLKEGTYTVEIIEDGDDAHYLTNRESLKVATRQLTNNDKQTLKLAPGGGACLVIKKNLSMGACEQVDIHDEYRSTGYSRTYPNLLTQEGIRGDEESPSLDQAIYTLYNRMICGAGDIYDRKSPCNNNRINGR